MKPTGGGPQVTPIAPPAPLFPGVAGAMGFGGGKGVPNPVGSTLGSSATNALTSIASGTNLSQLFKTITDASTAETKTGMADIRSAFGASGMGMSTDMMKSLTDYQTNVQKNLSAEFGKLGLENESMQLGGAQTIMQLATSFAPTQVVGQAPAGASPFSQVASAGEAAAMLYILAGMG